jgi:hypothetical protein
MMLYMFFELVVTDTRPVEKNGVNGYVKHGEQRFWFLIINLSA